MTLTPTSRPSRRKQRLLRSVAALLILLPLAFAAATTRPDSAHASASPPRVFAYYYLWWSLNHWKSALGSQYPATATPLPLPATLDASGCNPKAL